MKQIIFTLFIIIHFPSQSQNNQFSRFYATDDHMKTTDFAQLENSNLIFLGQDYSHALQDHKNYVFCTDTLGNILWSKWYIFPVSEQSTTDITATKDGNFIISGSSDYQDGSFIDTKFHVFKISKEGDLIWARKISKQNPPLETSHTFSLSLSDSSTISVSNFSFPFGNQIVKLDPSGNVIWNKSFTMGQNFTLCSIVEMPNGSLILSGWTQPTSIPYGVLINLSANGDLIWKKVFAYHVFHAITKHDSELRVIGFNTIGSTLNDFVFLKFDSLGNNYLNLKSEFGTSFWQSENRFSKIAQIDDSSYLIHSRDSDISQNSIIQVYESGNYNNLFEPNMPIRVNVLPIRLNEIYYCRSVYQNSYQINLVRANINSSPCLPNNSTIMLEPITNLSSLDTLSLITSNATFNATWDVTLLDLPITSYESCEGELSVYEHKINTNEVVIFPNPSNGNFTINNTQNDELKLEFYNINGELIETKIITDSSKAFEFNHLSSGIYLLKCTTNKGETSYKKIAIQK